jgi:DHA1 family tetracycline resistance protein-like MFS transporter
MQFVFAPVIGNLSDRFGRRPVLLASLLGFGVDYLVMAMAPTLAWLVVGRVIAGITGRAIPPLTPTSPTSPRPKSAPPASG